MSHEPTMTDQTLPTLEPKTQAFIDSLQLKGLPDALIVVDDDIFQDEGEAYARKLAQAGVRVTSVRYNGTVHDFVIESAGGHSGAGVG